jgi:hypothetical protein
MNWRTGLSTGVVVQVFRRVRGGTAEISVQGGGKFTCGVAISRWMLNRANELLLIFEFSTVRVIRRMQRQRILR